MMTQDDDERARQNAGRRAVEVWESEGGAQRFEQYNLISGAATEADPRPTRATPVVKVREQGD